MQESYKFPRVDLHDNETEEEPWKLLGAKCLLIFFSH